ncbi:MAG: vanillic acid non-oxidative decarboxylation protein [Thaumarchaeota archaeon]|nr:vanillic acid non-oxidative decarboxylation protein [Nitrososphaerota archaeon]
MNSTCPRCGGDMIHKVSDSPVAGAWEIFGCKHCNFLWRSTENLKGIIKVTDADMKEAIYLYKGRSG